MDYEKFLDGKTHYSGESGFTPTFLPSFLMDFQAYLVEWAVKQGRSAMFADCGMGKTLMLLTWAENVARKTAKPVLVLNPLAVTSQTVEEAHKFGIGCVRSVAGEFNRHERIIVTNYERLHLFNPSDFSGVVCDESGILKNFEGVYRNAITNFMRKMEYRLLCSATPAPNDYIELGNSSEALGYLGHMDMLNRFFKNDLNNSSTSGMYCGKKIAWRFKGHAEEQFWKWCVSWCRTIRKPSDIGFDDGPFVLPKLTEREYLVEASTLADGMLFALPAQGLREQREERRRTLEDRCKRVAKLADTGKPVICWGHLDAETDLMTRMISGAVQVSGKDSDEAKEEKFMAFIRGDIRALVTKPKIGAWGLNFQHCAHSITFPSHSFEQYYQLVRRCWRFGQKYPVTVDIVTTEGEKGVMENQRRKAVQAEEMFARIVARMNEQIGIDRRRYFTKQETVPSWL